MSIAALPTDCLLHVFSFLEAANLRKKTPLVCRQWRDLSNQDCLWQPLCYEKFSTKVKFNDQFSWKTTYEFLSGRMSAEVENGMIITALEELETGKFNPEMGC